MNGDVALLSDVCIGRRTRRGRRNVRIDIDAGAVIRRGCGRTLERECLQRIERETCDDRHGQYQENDRCCGGSTCVMVDMSLFNGGGCECHT